MKELIKTIMIILLVVVSGYLVYQMNTMEQTLATLDVKDSVRIVTIEQFDHGLNDLELQFIGRGKHIQQFQVDLQQMNNRLDESERNFEAKLDSTNLAINELRSMTESQLANLKTDQESLGDRITKLQRNTNQSVMDLQTALTKINRDFSDLEKRVKILETPPVEATKKK
ncbi:MAG: hypothetical protein COT43_04565 [Candidatus Marinimicrobia bacterium CG08_land_8_20_14_0_20_45_22]|nr:MAG: hypothetical protein COT43_04565 [Candidatus Marinimicrobia bacterium CG08_land_8_20_14_0_20_45_22]